MVAGGGHAGATASAPFVDAGPAPLGIDSGIADTATSTGLRPAERVIPPNRLPLPINPLPRCFVLDNYGDSRGSRTHEGVDILATEGQEVYAVERMRLTRQTIAGASSSSLSGNAWLAIGLSTGNEYFYAHLKDFAPGLAVNSVVERGELIGTVGDTGNPGAGNFHLHFEVHKYDAAKKRLVVVNPLPLLVIPSSCTVW